MEHGLAHAGLPDVAPLTIGEAVAVTACGCCGYPTLGAEICAYCRPTLAKPGSTLW